MAEPLAHQPTLYVSFRRPLIGGLLSALVTGALLWGQFYGAFHTPNRIPSMRLQALRLGAAVPGVLIGGSDLKLPAQIAIAVAFWFLEGGLIAFVIRKNWLAVGVWGLVYTVAYAVSYVLFFTFFP